MLLVLVATIRGDSRDSRATLRT